VEPTPRRVLAGWSVMLALERAQWMLIGSSNGDKVEVVWKDQGCPSISNISGASDKTRLRRVEIECERLQYATSQI
jgi:hypothetical protein